MGIYRRPSGVYWLTLTVHGKQIWEPCRTHNKKQAQKILAIRSAEISQGRYHRLVATKSPLLSAWADDFLATIREPSTKKRYSSSRSEEHTSELQSPMYLV